MELRIDHVTLAASRLEAIASALAAVGLETVYGGQHSNGATHMSMLGFEDGTYLELVSAARPGLQAPRWNDHIVRDLGPCSWAVSPKEVPAEAERLQGLGVPVDGPYTVTRSRPDGATVEWEVAYVGDHPPGAMHPFLIRDHTPRELRVQVSPSAAGAGLGGVDGVVLAVEDLDVAGAELRSTYGLGASGDVDCSRLGARVRCFPGSPVNLAQATAGGWLAERTASVGLSPCAVLLTSVDPALVRGRVALSEPEDWFGREVAWLDSDGLRSLNLAVVTD